ncbi:MAG TPA: allantoinase AllB [Tepidisphaeraceae bacterium]|nr:allantoinase AllB [Tepidisphaeraceae bacterium]
MIYDLVIRNGTVVRQSEAVADVAIDGESIVEIAPGISGKGKLEIDAAGLHVFPAGVDPHVHFNDPGRADWEGFDTGSAALLAGGGGTFFDMPLNSSPPTLDGPSFDAKSSAALGKSYADFGIWGGLTPGNLDRLEELAARGVVGFKAFMCASGIDDFARADDWALFQGMLLARQLGLIVAVHAENHEITAGLREMARRQNLAGVREYLRSRPQVAENEAIGRAIAIARETQCPLHIVHVSTSRGVELVARAREEGVDVTCETCAHYLVLSADDAVNLGALAKCAPPLRSPEDQKALWDHLSQGRIDIVASDHSPAPLSMKSSSNFFDVWGGVAGVQSTRAALTTQAHLIPPPLIARVTSSNPARRFGLLRKGVLELGFDADVALVNLGESFTLTREMLLDRHKLSPFVGLRFRGKVRQMILRGRTVFQDNDIIGPPAGRLVRPG